MDTLDKRIELTAGSLLQFPGMICKIVNTIGKGSNGIAYLGTYEDNTAKGQWHDVLIKELFPLHPDGAIYRDQENNIVIEP